MDSARALMPGQVALVTTLERYDRRLSYPSGSDVRDESARSTYSAADLVPDGLPPIDLPSGMGRPATLKPAW